MCDIIPAMQLWTTFKGSIYSPAFYRELRTRSFGFSFKYFYSLAAILALVAAAVVAFTAVPQLQFALQTLGAKALGYFPQDLEITVAKGSASANVAEPYFLKTPSDFLQSTSTTRYENLLVIDTSLPLSIEKFRSYHTTALLSKHDLLVSGKQGEVRVYSLEKVPDVKINKAWVEKVVGQFSPYLSFLGPIAVVLIFLGFLAYIT